MLNRIVVIGAAFAVVSTVAFAQAGALRLTPAGSLQVDVTSDTAPAPPPVSIPDGDLNGLRSAIAAARLGDLGGAEAATGGIRSEAGRKLAHWVIADQNGGQMSFTQLEPYRRELTGWPRDGKRRSQIEAVLETSSLEPSAIIGWFGGDAPRSAAGVMALAGAYQASGRMPEAQSLIRSAWRNQTFSPDAQASLLARYGGMLGPEDHAARANLLLFGQPGPALKAVIPLLPPDQAALAQARLALRTDARNAPQLLAAVPANLRKDGGLTVERAAYARRHDQPADALALGPALPSNLSDENAAARVWTERRQLINVALKRADYRAAYGLAANAGMTAPSDIVDAEFFAGWLALQRLNDPAQADTHFARIQAAGNAPITQARALYWRGRAHQALGDRAGAQSYFTQSARYPWTFYGQLAAGEAGLPITLGADPAITPADREAFAADERVQAAHMLAAIGERDLMRAFVLYLDDGLTNPAQFAQLVDLARASDDPDLALRVVRVAAQKGVFMPGRGYPEPSPPTSAVEPSLVLAITRQESSFDPNARSSADARGMMQLMPATAQRTAARMGEAYSLEALYDPAYNMRLGSNYLGELIDRFTGSYVLAVAGYNAGPNRSDDWITYCGDPRAVGTDPVDFIECIPFSETRNYVMRVLEGMQVYRAKSAKGEAPSTLAADLKRGSGVLAAASPAPSPRPRARRQGGPWFSIWRSQIVALLVVPRTGPPRQEGNSHQRQDRHERSKLFLRQPFNSRLT